MVMVHQPLEPGRPDPFEDRRRRMVDEQIAKRGIRDPRVLGGMARVWRHRFVPGDLTEEAYADNPLPIGEGQTISQPYIVAFMIEALQLPLGARVLDVGTGSGYQAAVLAESGFRVYSVEIRAPLAEEARKRLRDLGYSDVHVRVGDGALGWPEEAPFDGIVVAAAPETAPPALFEQLGPEGRLVIPLGGSVQGLWRYRRTPSGLLGEELLPVRFVPMAGKAESTR